ncbi:MAG: PAS domain-containing protein, partial [Pleurocapsa sp.]
MGEAETTGSFDSEFQPLNKKWKLYQKRRNVRLPFLASNSFRTAPRYSINRKTKSDEYLKESIKEQTLKRILQDDNAIALAVNRQNHLLYVGGDAQHIFKTPNGEITRDNTKKVILPLQLPLNTALHRARKKKQAVTYRGIKISVASEVHQVNIQVLPPAIDSQDDLYIVKIEPEAIVAPSSFVEEFETSSQAQQRINELELELQYTRENLQAIVEELESTNEEQQASNEELIASNEELQSTNEELHSVNEEMHTVNAEYQSKIQQLTELGNDLDNLLQSTKIGVIFLDRQLRIRKFTPAASEVFALRHTDVERPLSELFWKIECPNLLDLLQDVLETKQSQELEVRLKQKNDYFLMGINLYQAGKLEDKGLVITFVKINETKKAQFALKESERSFQAIFNSMFQFIGVLTPAGITLEANRTALEFGGLTLEDVLNKPFCEVKWWTISDATQEQLKNAIARAAKGEFVRYEVDILGAKARVATIDFSIKPVLDDTGKVVQLLLEGREISELKKTREELKQTNLDLENRVTERTQTLALFSDHLQQIHRLAIAHHEQIEDLYADYLQAGCHMFKLSTGIVSQINQDTYKIAAIESPLDLAVGYETSYALTYCAEVIETRSTITYNRVGEIEAMKNHPVYLNLKLESYISKPILVNGKERGTLNLSCSNARKTEYTEG